MANWYPSPTIDSHLESHTPQPDYELEREWHWRFWKFGYNDPNVLFTTLHSEFNSMKCAIQDPYGWHHDVCDVASTAKNKEEFLTLLEQRQKEWFDEIRSAWEKTKALLTGQPSRWKMRLDKDVLWESFIRLARNFSYDSLVRYFGPYIADNRTPNVPLPPTSAKMRPVRPEQPKRKTRGPAMKSSRSATTRSSGVSKSRR